MVPTATGLIIIVIGIWCQFGDVRRILFAMIVLSPFEAASAADLPALGGASIPPAKLFLLFFVLRLVSMRSGFSAILAELSPRRVLFLYLLLLVWVVASALFLPRLFEGVTQVFTLARSDSDEGIAVPVPLKPAGGNITQGAYAVGSFVLALGTCVIARKPGAYATILSALLWLTGLDIFFALFDLATAATHTEFLLDLIHTGGYVFLTSDESGGLKRISGTFSEASAFATFSLELLAVNMSLLLSGVRPRLTAVYSLALAVLLFISTSSTAYVGLAIVGTGFGVGAVVSLLRHRDTRPLRVLATATGVGLFVLCLGFLIAPSVLLRAWELLDVSLFQKSQSDSALERGALNSQAARIFWDTYGIGAGVGSTRTSNYMWLLASNLGIVGVALFASLVVALAVLRPRPDLPDRDRAVVTASRAGMLASLVPAALVGAIFDLGVIFYVFIGVVASSAPRGRMVAALARPTRREAAFEIGAPT